MLTIGGHWLIVADRAEAVEELIDPTTLVRSAIAWLDDAASAPNAPGDVEQYSDS